MSAIGNNETQAFDAVVVGAGFAGLYMLHRLRGLGLSVRVIESGSDVGGTWYWNRYPGARCDVESMQYSYSFDEDLQQEWNWSERFAPQPEILAYANHVADRFDLRRDIQFDDRVLSARFDEASARWTILTQAGRTFNARFCIMATGCLSAPKDVDLPGLASFRGRILRTSTWPKEGVDLSGRRVALVGTGSSAVQAIPEIAKQAKSLHVFQRTATYTVPARNAPLSEDFVREWKADYPQRRRQAREECRSGTIYEFGPTSALAAGADDRESEYARRWKKGGANFMYAYNDLLLTEEANETAAEFVRARIRDIVKDPVAAAALSPTSYPIGTKRICVDTGYYETFNRPSVTLVDLRKTPIREIVAEGVATSDQTYEADDLVLATGFDALTGALDRIDIRGRGGQRLAEKWAAGPRTYLGLMVHGFPNLFTIAGPGSPSVLSNVIVSIEQHVEWIAGCLTHLNERGAAVIEPSLQAEDAWVDHVNEVAGRTLYPRTASWYMGANVPGKPRIFLPYVGGVDAYRRLCREIVEDGYRGFEFGAVPAAAAAQ
jgi:cyclohexanone monooxygenase